MSIKIAGRISGKIIKYNNGILFNIISDQKYECYYPDKYQIFNDDIVVIIGNFDEIEISDKKVTKFICSFITARTKRDLFIFLSNYFINYKTDQLDTLVLKFEEYVNLTGQTESLVQIIGKLAQNVAKQFLLYKDDVKLLSSILFPNVDDDTRIGIVRKFLLFFYSNYLTRPFELLGITPEICNTFRIS